MAGAATLSGQVTDQTDGTGLEGAIVRVVSTDGSAPTRTVASGENGKYTLSDMAEGEYTITGSYIGFLSQTSTVQIGAGATVERALTLAPSVMTMQSISVTASRTEEKVLESPAAVNVMSSEEISTRATLSPADHVKGMPGVDVASAGLNQSNIVVRGFNNVLSGALLLLTDNRIARVPSIRYNAHHFLPVTNEDIDRIEVVSGPGSALYGPNSASGVMHIITRSPFTSQGTTISVGGGERELMLGSFRHAGTFSNRIGYKLTGQYYQGLDWKSYDSFEPDSITFFRPTATGPVTEGGVIANDRNFDTKKLSGTGRIDFILNENSSLILNGGVSQMNNIELTGNGAAQAVDWTYWYAQARYKYKDLFIQGFVNASNAGDSYFLRTGQLLIDRSKVFAAQLQHRVQATAKLDLTYGLDLLFTRPETESTINGRNEDDDTIDEAGVYLQANYRLSRKFKLVGAARYDDNSELEDAGFSPRGGLVYQPTDNHNFRATYNQAFQTPDNTNLFLDVLQARDPFGVGAAFLPSLMYSPNIDVRAQGVPRTGFHWNYDAMGNPRFRSPFAPVDPRGLTSSDFIDFNDPIFTNVMWSLGRGAVLSGLSDNLTTLGLPLGQVTSILGAVDAVAPTTVSSVDNALLTFDPDISNFAPSTVSDIADIERLKSAITNTFEVGYKGIINNRFQISVDLYTTKKENFVAPLTVESPNVFLDPTTLGISLGPDFATNYASQTPAIQATLDSLDLVAFGGNGNGSPVDELTAMFTAGAARIPFGTVSPIEASNPTDVLVTYRNIGNINFYGADFAFDVHVSQHFDFGGTYSYVSKNFFARNTEQVHDIFLNAPRHKIGVRARYSNQRARLSVQSRIRWVDAFEMQSPFVGSSVESFVVVDLSTNWAFTPSTTFNLTIQNLLDNEHSEFVGAPSIGRLVISRVTQSF